MRFPAVLLAALALVRPAVAQLGELRLEPFLEPPGVPVALTQAGDRLYLSLLGGQVRVLEDGELLPEPFLDISEHVPGRGLGLWSLAFHPRFPEVGRVFVHYAERGTGDSLISRFELSAGGDRVDPSSEVVLLRIAKEHRLHYGGQLSFGPDGYLYASTGDGTGPENLVDPACAAQSLSSLEGKILRLDVDTGAGAPPYFSVPPDNPFAGGEGGEIWAYGLRNPWRFSFDRATGDLWISDVGQARREELNLQRAGTAGGENYGWKVMEGSTCFRNQSGCDGAVPPCGDGRLTLPAIEYNHDGGRCAVIGGPVYRGSALPQLEGRLIYGDFCSGELWAATPERAGYDVERLPFQVPNVTSIAEDGEGELYFLSRPMIWRLTGPSAPPPAPATCAADAHHLCLNGDRFQVSVSFRTADGQTGRGRGERLDDGDAGYFYFFSANNPEVFVKVLDACAFEPPHFWVFAAGLTDVETRLEVVDTATGDARTYERPLGRDYQPVRDTRAFETCP